MLSLSIYDMSTGDRYPYRLLSAGSVLVYLTSDLTAAFVDGDVVQMTVKGAGAQRRTISGVFYDPDTGITGFTIERALDMLTQEGFVTNLTRGRLITPNSLLSVSGNRAYGGGGRIFLSIIGSEDDPNLGSQLVSSRLDWNNGIDAPVTRPATPGILRYTAAATVLPGEYEVSVTLKNFRSPREDKIKTWFRVHVTSEDATTFDDNPIWVGPILPRDSGQPGVREWVLNRDRDLRVLESSVKQLLLTNTGERLMEPTYGTSLRRLLFDPNDPPTHDRIAAEVSRALAAWEPRVTLSALNIFKDGTRAELRLTLDAAFRRQSFQITVPFS